MSEIAFQTIAGIPVPAVTADEMREIDRVAVDDVGLQLLQMMENAGRNLAVRVCKRDPDQVAVLAGNGGNGGGGLACARHLANHDVSVTIVLDRSPDALDGAAAAQYRILNEMNVSVTTSDGSDACSEANTVVDSLIGYGLQGEPRGQTRDIIDYCNNIETPMISLDVPSGFNATTGERPGSAIEPAEILTLALPKTGLQETECPLYLADISIPSVVYDRVGIDYHSPFEESYFVALDR